MPKAGYKGDPSTSGAPSRGESNMGGGTRPMKYAFDQRPMGLGGTSRSTPTAMTSQDMYASPSGGNIRALAQSMQKSDPKMAKYLSAEAAQISPNGIGFKYGPARGSESMPGKVGGRTSGRGQNQTTHKGPAFAMPKTKKQESKPPAIGARGFSRAQNQGVKGGPKTSYVRFNKTETKR